MRNLTLTTQFCDIPQSFVSDIKYENIYLHPFQYIRNVLKRELRNKYVYVSFQLKF
jgi:hypothetical protein